jgi:hypothetical protein
VLATAPLQRELVEVEVSSLQTVLLELVSVVSSAEVAHWTVSKLALGIEK